MLAVRCCAQPPKHESAFKLPKRLARARRVAESKRMDTFREIHTALKKTAHDEVEFIQAFFNKDKDGKDRWWGTDEEVAAAADEAAAENEE